MMMMMMAVDIVAPTRLEVYAGRQFLGAVWAAVRNSAGMFGTFMMSSLVVMVMVVLVACKGMDTLHTETLHLMDGPFGARFGVIHTCDDFCEDAAENIFTFGVGGVGGKWDEIYRMKGQLEVN